MPEVSDPQDLSRVADRQAISDVLHRYARAVDRLDRDLFGTCFHADAQIDYGMATGGVDDVADTVWSMLAALAGSHHALGTHNVELSGELAWSEIYFTATLQSRPAEPPLPDAVIKGRYIDTLERRAGDWRIARRSALEDSAHLVMPSPEVSGLLLTGSRATDDPSYDR